jgi:hypothetical protein
VRERAHGGVCPADQSVFAGGLPRLHGKNAPAVLLVFDDAIQQSASEPTRQASSKLFRALFRPSPRARSTRGL